MDTDKSETPPGNGKNMLSAELKLMKSNITDILLRFNFNSDVGILGGLRKAGQIKTENIWSLLTENYLLMDRFFLQCGGASFCCHIIL